VFLDSMASECDTVTMTAPDGTMPTTFTRLEGEDRKYMSALCVDLMPKTCWWTNLAHLLQPSEWTRLQRLVCTRANNTCETCGKEGLELQPERERHIEGRWEYRSASQLQRLVRVLLLCDNCYYSTRMGLARIKDRSESATTHLTKILNQPTKLVTQHIDEAFQVWRDRSLCNWDVDLYILTASGFQLIQPIPTATERATIGRRVT